MACGSRAMMPGHDDEGDAVADAAARDLLADPHQEQGAADEAHRPCDLEQKTRSDHRLDALLQRLGFEALHREIALDERDRDREIARILVELLAPRLALFPQRLPGAVEGGAELNDDRGCNVGHDAECDDREALKSAAREGVEDIEDAAALRLVERAHGRRIDTGHRDEREKAEEDQRTKGEPQPLLKLGRFLKVREREAGGQMFGCGCHRLKFPGKTNGGVKARRAASPPPI